MTTTQDAQQITTTLHRFQAELEHCINAEYWEQLIEVLDKRQLYFEQLFSDSDALEPALKNMLIQQVLVDDNRLVTQVMEQKDSVEQERIKLARSRQAVRAYQ